MRSLPILVLLFMTLALPALAGDGVLEINQTCAGQTGCFAGDTPGLPVTISASGSYRLTSNLVVTNASTDGIVVSTDNVSIDLAGFEIEGPVVCSGTPLACTPSSGTGSGVERTTLTLSGMSVRNGSIRGMGNYGVLLGGQSEVTNVRVRSNRTSGISTSGGSTVSGNTAYQNGGSGIYGGGHSTVSGNTAYENGGSGISTTSGSIVSGNTAHQNGDNGIYTSGSVATISGNTAFNNEVDGIYAVDASIVSGNTAYQNGGNGINANNGCTIIGNSTYDNGDASNPTLDDGIECGNGCIVRENSVRANSGYGLNLATDSAYGDNVVTGNTTGTVTGAGSANSRGGNYCAGTGVGAVVCP